MTILEALKLPDPAALASEFGCRGFVRVPKLLDRDHVSKLFDLATRLLRQHGIAVDRDGGAQSLGHRLRYEVVTGDRIKADGGMLFSMYAHHDLLSWLRILTNAPVLDVSPHLRSAININCLSKAGHQYPWHQDAVPYTCLLFLTSMPTAAGGELLIRAADGDAVAIRPVAGDFMVMDGARCPHAVAPLSRDALRLTVPMVYPIENRDRPTGLDDYLYANTPRQTRV